MAPLRPVFDLLARLGGSEKILLHKHGVRLRVDKVTLDGRNVLCSATQVQRRFLRPDHTQEAVVEFCQSALSPLYRVGLSPLIRAYPHVKGEAFGRIDANDPFGLRSALIIAGSEGLLLPEFILPMAPYSRLAPHRDQAQAND